MAGKVVFLDFDNTLSDFDTLGVQYVRQLGRLLSGRWGGAADAWEQCVSDTLKQLFTGYKARFEGNPLAGFNLWMDEARVTFVECLCQTQKIALPANAIRFAIEIQAQALSLCNAAYPGAAEVLETLAQAGVRLHMASAWDSGYLHAALTGAGLARYIENKYGPDLVDCAKEGPEFYERIFATMNLRPSDALVIDDNPDTLRWILQTGATAIQSRLAATESEEVPGVAAVLTDWRDLPVLIKQIEHG
jgi:FMN phosphatase YigB (HAD superfamily)